MYYMNETVLLNEVQYIEKFYEYFYAYTVLLRATGVVSSLNLLNVEQLSMLLDVICDRLCYTLTLIIIRSENSKP